MKIKNIFTRSQVRCIHAMTCHSFWGLVNPVLQGLRWVLHTKLHNFAKRELQALGQNCPFEMVSPVVNLRDVCLSLSLAAIEGRTYKLQHVLDDNLLWNHLPATLKVVWEK